MSACTPELPFYILQQSFLMSFLSWFNNLYLKQNDLHANLWWCVMRCRAIKTTKNTEIQSSVWLFRCLQSDNLEIPCSICLWGGDTQEETPWADRACFSRVTLLFRGDFLSLVSPFLLYHARTIFRCPHS